MDDDEEVAELTAQEAKLVRDEAEKCLRHASFYNKEVVRPRQNFVGWQNLYVVYL
jgi:hypothetical protein